MALQADPVDLLETIKGVEGVPTETLDRAERVVEENRKGTITRKKARRTLRMELANATCGNQE